MFRYKFSSLILSILLICFLTGCNNKPQVTGEEFDEIDVSQEPEQIASSSNDPIIKNVKDGKFTITPVAKYKIAGVVVSKKSYNDGWRSELAPFDLALAWGKLAEPEYSKYITYSQSDRWYFYEYGAGSPFDNNFVISHSSNNHIIPSNENILRAIKIIKKEQKIILEGFLVNLKGRYRDGNFWWNSSLIRTDTGDGSCELIYVKKVRIGNYVYE